MMCLDGYRPSKMLTISGVLIATGVSCVSLQIALLYWSLFAANCALCRIEDSLMLLNLRFFSSGLRLITALDSLYSSCIFPVLIRCSLLSIAGDVVICLDLFVVGNDRI